ncbi:MAG TPA: hypothetical protein PL033_02255 [Candidatus Brocadiia bacterium]|nr:hypothetical protein [Candidatus Brocadiia bacterium]
MKVIQSRRILPVWVAVIFMFSARVSAQDAAPPGVPSVQVIQVPDLRGESARMTIEQTQLTLTYTQGYKPAPELMEKVKESLPKVDGAVVLIRSFPGADGVAPEIKDLAWPSPWPSSFGPFAPPAQPEPVLSVLIMGYHTMSNGTSVLIASGFRFMVAQKAVLSNPDVDTIAAGFPAAAGAAVAAYKQLDARNLAYSFFYLSYIQPDQALAALQALGFTVMDFDAKAGASPGDMIYTMKQQVERKLPVIAKIVDYPNDSLVQKPTATQAFGLGVTPQVGGQNMSKYTATAQDGRLMIIYDPDLPAQLHLVESILKQDLDIAAQQILIEALVIELERDKMREMGTTWDITRRVNDEVWTADFDPWAGNSVNQSYTLGLTGARSSVALAAKMRLLVTEGYARIVSRPSVLALNNRQALIRIGREIPATASTVTSSSTNLVVNYFSTGVVLNIKPRINADGTEVSMQIESIISQDKPDDPSSLKFSNNVVPVVKTRLVQTFGRVTDGTPFIIGGLLARNNESKRRGLPILSHIPLIGNLFADSTQRDVETEVIVVLIPHIVPRETLNWGYILPKDAEDMNVMNRVLYRNSYRIQNQDLFSLSFLRSNRRLTNVKESVADLVSKEPSLAQQDPFSWAVGPRIPADEIFVKRMLYEIIKRQGMEDSVKDMIFFQPRPREEGGIKVKFLKDYIEPISGGFRWPWQAPKPFSKAIVVKFDAIPDDQMSEVNVPTPVVETADLPEGKAYEKLMLTLNKCEEELEKSNYAIVLTSPDDVDRLKRCVILKEVIKLNAPGGKLHLSDFIVGRELLFPELKGRDVRPYMIDNTVAQLYYESDFYYLAFEDSFQRKLEVLEKGIEEARARQTREREALKSPGAVKK